MKPSTFNDKAVYGQKLMKQLLFENLLIRSSWEIRIYFFSFKFLYKEIICLSIVTRKGGHVWVGKWDIKVDIISIVAQ